MSEPSKDAGLAGLRERIDALDARLIELLNERAKVVVEIGHFKRSSGGAIYAPHRESEVLARVLGRNRGPLPDRCIERIYRELMSGSFALERPLRIGYLGPVGSHSHVAARLQFGASVAFENLRSVAGVFEEVQRAHVDYGLVPIESLGGEGVAETLAAFDRAHDRVFAYAEVQSQIRYHLLARCTPKEVRTIYCKPEVYGRCREWVQSQYPQARIEYRISSSQAVQDAAKECEGGQEGVAAIGTELAAQGHELPTLFDSVGDDPHHLARYLVISRQEAQASGDDKTALIFSTSPRSGALSEILSLFAEYEMNLTHIDKRQSLPGDSRASFFIEVQGHRHDPGLAKVLERMSERCEDLRVLGSFPCSRRVL